MHTVKIAVNLLFEYQCTGGKFISLANRIESKKNRFGVENRIQSNRNFFCPNWNALIQTIAYAEGTQSERAGKEV